MNAPVRAPEPPYYAVIFTSTRRDPSPDDGYGEMAARMERLAEEQPGYLGLEAAREGDGLGVTISYWADRAAATAWKQVAEHRAAQALGRARWYGSYALRICRVEAARDWDAADGPDPGDERDAARGAP